MSRRSTLFICAALFLTPVAYVGVSAVTRAISTTQGIANRTFNADNIINNYEWFHDVHNAYKTRLRQIDETANYLKAETNDAERFRLRTELSGQKQHCRDLAARYNANATKSNRSIFMGREAPYSLSVEACG